MRPHRLIASAAGLALALAGAACSSPKDAPNASLAPPPVASRPALPDDTRIAADLPPLPFRLSTAVRAPQVVRAAYEFAARHPEVLRYIPCFCGCERGGHKDNTDCFVAGRDGVGRVTAWDSHGVSCEVCIDVAQQTMQMHNSGSSLTAIRGAIEAKYAAPGRPHTPTPMPPHRGGTHD